MRLKACLFIALLFAKAASAETETTVQAALEGVPSGVTVTGVADDGVTPTSVRPLRTWKSETGHFCRSYNLRIGGSNPRSETLTRCRETSGGWVAIK